MNSSLNNSKSWGIQSNPSSQNINYEANQDTQDNLEEQKQSSGDAQEEVEKLQIQYELEKSMIDMKYKQ